MVFIKGEKTYRKPVNAVIKLRKPDKKGIFLSNNSTLSRQEYVKKMEKLGIKVSIDEVFNSGCITAQILKKNNWIRLML